MVEREGHILSCWVVDAVVGYNGMKMAMTEFLRNVFEVLQNGNCI